MKRVAILQTNYIPWKGYFDLIASVDEFICYDCVQYTNNDWRNRNRVATPQGALWLTVPVHGSLHKTVSEVAIAGAGWAERHWKTLAMNYARAPCFTAVQPWLQPLYQARRWHLLSDMNTAFITAICAFLGIGTQLTRCQAYTLEGDRTGRLVSLCRQAGADCYVSGPAARTYLDEKQFAAAGVRVEWFDYAGYPTYRQLWHQPFRHDLSVLDLLFNCGADATRHLKGLRSA